MKMDERLQAYLDGDVSLDELPQDLREQAEAWDFLLSEVRRTAPVGAPLGLQRRVLEAVPAGRSRPAWLEWMLRARPIPISPATAALAAAALAFVVLGPLGRRGSPPSPEPEVYVQFVVEAPTAQSVHLVGDFNEWQPTVALEDPDGDGVWSGRALLRPGVHEYMFVIDGDAWITDPNAPSYKDDGFGQRNALVAVASANGT